MENVKFICTLIPFRSGSSNGVVVVVVVVVVVARIIARIIKKEKTIAMAINDIFFQPKTQS